MRFSVRYIYKVILRKNVISLQKRMIRRWKQIDPDAEVVVMGLPKSSREEREQMIESVKSIYLSQDYQDFCDGKGRWANYDEKCGKKNKIKFV